MDDTEIIAQWPDKVTVTLSQRDASFAAEMLRQRARNYPLGHRRIAESVAEQLEAAVVAGRAAYQAKVDARRNYVRRLARDGYLYTIPNTGAAYMAVENTYERQLPESEAALKQLIGDGVLERDPGQTFGDLMRVVLADAEHDPERSPEGCS